MASSSTRMPSFTLVLISNWHFLHGYPTAIKFDPCAPYTMLPVVTDHLLPPIDLVGGPADNNQLHLDQSVAYQTTDEEPPSIRGTKKKVTGATKRYALMTIRSLKKGLSGVTKSSTTRGIF